MHNNRHTQIIKSILDKEKQAYIVYIDLVQFEQVEDSHGELYAQEFLTAFKKVIFEEIHKILPSTIYFIDIYHLWGDDFVVILEGQQGIEEELCKVLTTLERNIENKFSSSLPSYFKDYNGIHIGIAGISPPAGNIEKQYYKVLKKAYKQAKNDRHCLPMHIVNEFQKILNEKCLQSVYQPIISLETGNCFGWEALTRGPQNSFFYSPNELFSFAEKNEALFTLERISRELSIKNVGHIQPHHKLFLNVNPTVINDPEFSKGVTRHILKQYGLTPQQIVFEITERTSIQNFNSFRKTVDHYRNQGYLIAVDDAGAGYSSLQSIAEIRPDFIKLDMSITRNIDKDSVKKALLETFVTFTKKINCELITEGIETASELSIITKLGVHYGQGYFISKPAFPKPEPSKESIETIDAVSSRRLKVNWLEKDITAKDLITHVPIVKEGTIIEDVAELFEGQPDIHGVVVLDQWNRPRGFLLRQTLYKYLIGRYGVALYYRKPIEELMNTRPLTVQMETPIDVVAKLAMKREVQYLYDILLVIDRENYLGVITVQNLLECLTQMKVEQARYANPLTGLAGNIIIEKEIEHRLLQKTDDVIMYIDIDFFKPYNDIYGFEQGDRFILLISKILKHVVKKNKDIFLGHIGGDDFVIICPYKMAAIMAEKILKLFKRLAKYYYNKEDWDAQVLVATDRLGRSCVYPLSTLSIAGVIIDNSFENVIQVGERAALLKREVKKIAGNAYIIEERKI